MHRACRRRASRRCKRSPPNPRLFARRQRQKHHSPLRQHQLPRRNEQSRSVKPSRRPLPLCRLRHKNRAASSSALSVPHADPISWHIVPACSQAVPQRSSACSKMRRGSRRRARPRLRPSLKLPAKAPLLERLRQLPPQRPQLLRLARCRRCVRAKLSPSCGYATPSIRRCARAFRLAVAGSFPVWRRMRRHCRPPATPR